MTWDARPICLDCQRTIHGPGTGPVGPRDVMGFRAPQQGPKAPRCVLCSNYASPAAYMRLWRNGKEDRWTDSTV